MKKIFFILLLISSTFRAQESQFDSLVIGGLNQVYNMQLEDAERSFDRLQNKFPSSPAPLFLRSMVTWWKIMTDFKNEIYDEDFYDSLEVIVDFCDELLDEDDENEEALFFKGAALGYKARLLSIRKEWFDAAMEGKDAFQLINEVYRINPRNKDIELGFGIYNYYVSVIPEKYTFVKPLLLFFPGGDKELGIKQLKNVSENGKFAKYEARYFLMTLNYSFENNYTESLKYANILYNDFPNNPAFQRYRGRIFVKTNNLLQAKEIFEDVIIKCENNFTGYNTRVEREAEYYVGLYFYTQKLYNDAVIHFSKSFTLSKSINEVHGGFYVNSLLYLAKIHDSINKKEDALRFYNIILEAEDYKGSHLKATKYIEAHTTQN